MILIRWLLLPASLLYGIVIAFRNLFFDTGILKSESFAVPVIAIGNLSSGGTGKSPMTEYLLRLFNGKKKLAVLSRGYGRSTYGFRWVNSNSLASEVGDEPRQFKNKFPQVVIAVCEKRTDGIKTILEDHSETELIILDDAFQHRSVKPKLSILLIDYKDVFRNDMLLPTGSLREWKSGIKRADIVVITKCDTSFSAEQVRQVLEKLKLSDKTSVFFSFIKYMESNSVSGFINSSNGKYDSILNSDSTVLVFTGIANPDPLIRYLEGKVKQVLPIRFKDHHRFSVMDIQRISEKFNTIVSKNKLIITTEKDLMRLDTPELKLLTEKLPLYYLPIEMAFHSTQIVGFDERLLKV